MILYLNNQKKEKSLRANPAHKMISPTTQNPTVIVFDLLFLCVM